MRNFPVIVFLALGICSCDSVKKSVIQTDKNVEKLAVAMNDHASSSGAVQNLNAKEYEEFVRQKNNLVIVHFHADRSEPCKELAPILDSLAVEYGDRVAVGNVDVDACAELATQLDVKGLPDLRFYRDGEQVDRVLGLSPESDLRSRIDKLVLVKKQEEKASEQVPPGGIKNPGNIVQNAIQKANGPATSEEKPATPKPAQKPSAAKEPQPAKDPKAAENTQTAKPPEKPKGPVIQPMQKDWMPPGMHRKGKSE